jgi:hypothetical protein
VNRARFNFVLCLVLFWPVAGWAHALSPTYYPLGPLPISVGAENWPVFALIPLSILVEAFVLWAWARGLGTLGSLWRATVLYIVAKAAETAAIYVLVSIPRFRGAGWSSSNAENFGPLALCLAAGLVVAVPVGLLLYGRTDMKATRVVIAVCTASLAGYCSALVCSLLFVNLRGY